MADGSASARRAAMADGSASARRAAMADGSASARRAAMADGSASAGRVAMADRGRCINWLGFWVVDGQKLKILMCVLASVRNFFVVCFEGVARNSIGGALSIRSGRPLAHFEVTTGSFW